MIWILEKVGRKLPGKWSMGKAEEQENESLLPDTTKSLLIEVDVKGIEEG